MKRCACCKTQEAELIWQPLGPGASPNCFAFPGSHYRGFAAIPICYGCRERFDQGGALTFRYKGQEYTLPTPGADVATLRAAWEATARTRYAVSPHDMIAWHNVELEFMKAASAYMQAAPGTSWQFIDGVLTIYPPAV